MSELKFNSINEILSFAITEEHEAHLYYTTQAKKAQIVELRMIWQQLANDELRHESILSELLEKVEGGNESFFTNKDMPDYVAVKFPENDYSEVDLVIMEAIKKENDAYFMYKNLALKMNNEKHKDVLISMAHEELKHKETLLKELDL